MLMAESVDQTDNLHRIARPQPVRVIAVTSGKGGVGKTNVSVNLGITLASQGKEVIRTSWLASYTCIIWSSGYVRIEYGRACRCN
jgi:RecA-family ATPase